MKEKYKIYGINLFWFILIAFLSYKMPYYVDDYQHRLSFLSGEEIEHISQIFPSIFAYYMTWGGRIVSMFFIQLMLMLPRMVYALCNGIVYVIVANIILSYSRIAKKDYGQYGMALALLYLFLWFFMPDFAEVITWPTGTITYLWTNCVILFFGLQYYKECFFEEAQKCNNLFVSSLFYVFMGLLAGQSNEAGASTLLFSLFLYCIWKIRNKSKFSIDKILGILFTFVGFTTLILAPGNSVRTNAVADASQNTNVVFNYLYRIGRETFYGGMYLLIPLGIVLAVYVFAYYKKNSSVDKYKLLQEISLGREVLFILFAFVSVYVMTFSAGFANRIFQLPLLLIGISLCISLESILPEKTSLALRKTLVVFCLVMMMMSVYEVITGSLLYSGRDSFYDRQVIYYHIYDTEGAIPGNGI